VRGEHGRRTELDVDHVKLDGVQDVAEVRVRKRALQPPSLSTCTALRPAGAPTWGAGPVRMHFDVGRLGGRTCADDVLLARARKVRAELGDERGVARRCSALDVQINPVPH
jgi:hypothetical protein